MLMTLQNVQMNYIQPDLLFHSLAGSQPSFRGLLGTPFQNPFSLHKQEILNSFSSLVSSLKSCSLFTTAAHKRHFSPLFCLPTTYSYTHISNCSKDLEICILHIKLQSRANKEPKQNKLAYKRKIPRCCTCCL